MIKQILKQLTRKKYIYIVERGNAAIDIISKRYNTILIPEEGGWIHYKKISKETVKCNEAVIDLEDLKTKQVDAFLYHQPGGYFAEQPTFEIHKICKEKNIVVIQDIAGSIGTDLVGNADIIIGSFGKWKLVDAGKGGFIATDEELDVKEFTDEETLKIIEKKLLELPGRIKYLNEIKTKVIKDLKDYGIVKSHDQGIVIIIKYKDEQEKSDIETYCQKNDLEWTECPRYIRINEQAISIEIKRK
jgi:hypothetical protein